MGYRGILFFILTGTIGLLAGCSSEQADRPAPLAPAAEAAVRSVGDEACASCHEGLYQSYHRTGMGRSVSVFDPADAPEAFDDVAPVYNERFDYYYEPFVRGDTLFQREYRTDREGRVIHDEVHAAAWVIGSGNATRSYLMSVGGHVTEMPLTWYIDAGRWDLSPGYEQQNFRFGRPIDPLCMTCHNGLPEYSAYSINHYEDVPLGITCERCHGPGGDHTDFHLSGREVAEGEADPTIVNPARLERSLQLSVCQQCHLTGQTVFKPGEDAATFRPGELLAAHRSVFVIEEQVDDPERFGIASHAQRLALSACYEAGAMTCTTCHDPHRSVAELGPASFNQACLSCHSAGESEAEAVCSREEAHTPAEAMTGNCVGCHMQRSGTSDIPHVTFTDHWIRRTLPPPKKPEDIERVLLRRTPFRLVRAEGEATSEAEGLLEEAVAYFELYETRHEIPDYLPQVVQKARQGLAGGADHPEARLALGRALAAMDSIPAATRALAEAAARYPEHGRIPYWLGVVQVDGGQPEAALPALQAAVSLQPTFSEAQLKLAEVLSTLGRQDEAEALLRDLLDRDPVHHPDAWNNLGFILLQAQRFAEAEDALERAVALDPDLATAWVNLGSIMLLQEDYEGALDPLERAVAADPGYVPALGNLGLVYMNLGRTDRARVMFEQVLQYQPGDTRARSMLDQLPR